MAMLAQRSANALMHADTNSKLTLETCVEILREKRPNPTIDPSRIHALRIIANTIGRTSTKDERFLLQEFTRALGGVVATLNHTRLDFEYPTMREWALFAVRVLCDGNELVQQEIAALKPHLNAAEQSSSAAQL